MAGAESYSTAAVSLVSVRRMLVLDWINAVSLYVQLGSSSRAKHGGAYFSAVFGRKFDPTTVLRPCQPLACYWRVGIAAAPTLFTTSAKHHGSR